MIIISGCVLMFTSGCSFLGNGYPSGSVYNSTTTPHAADRQELSGPAKTGDKSGEACATGILGAAAWGDASIDAAKKAAKISEVHSVELRSFSILGAYVVGCTEVHGK
jgi:hypothetical protein